MGVAGKAERADPGTTVTRWPTCDLLTRAVLKPTQQQSADERDARGSGLVDGRAPRPRRSTAMSRSGSSASAVQDSGVAVDADIVVATASLEVGFDDDRVGAVLQHKAPHEVAQFLQRKGRAGRNPATRPWTVVVLSNWGRDRDAWDAYDALFSPGCRHGHCPSSNLYVLRIQAVYSCWTGWQSNRGARGRVRGQPRAGPRTCSRTPTSKGRHIVSDKSAMAALLGSLLREGTERESLRRHLRSSLALGFGDRAHQVVDQIFWEAPRPLLTAVVPTLRRRLMDQWAGERPRMTTVGSAPNAAS